MAERGDRFRHLRTPGTGDLFEHFGVSTAPEPSPAPRAADGHGPTAVVAVAACDGCGWYRPLPVRGPCPLCGAPGRGGDAAR